MAELLIVDDDSDMADLLSDFLRSKGHDVRVAPDGQAGLALLADRRPDAIVLDVEMPVMTGPELAHELFVRDSGLESIPVLLCSGILNLPKVAERVGTPYFLAKPYALDVLDRSLGRALEERRAPIPLDGSGS
jgi:DNA-binding NtrC family response regulator